ncbi:MAG: PhzF family phenazine biosynthesis protein [Candidatus Obscuribacterales bacterium]|nr:PhzF family phenazine biosynthesis protein [Candidatus Obscuribacterales bacterium]
MLAYLVDAFTSTRFEGNRAGVVFDADQLSRNEKQQIATEIGASETAFISKSNVADFKVEFFTPKTEIDFCGHATIATFYALAELGKVSLDRGVVELTQETKAGVMPISIIRKDGLIKVMMKQRNPQFKAPELSLEELAAALNIEADQLDSRFPPMLSNTGNWHLITGVGSKEILDNINYDAALLSQILQRNEAVTIHVFCPGSGKTFFARNFCPTIGIPEDPATGAAAGAFAAYLGNLKQLPDGDNEIHIVQGEAMLRPSQITARLHCNNGNCNNIQVEGTATLSFTLSSHSPVEATPCVAR